ncbi:MAG: class I SAM-dependent methyltransferase [Clostridia bacterium]|nr:class I SAM-dependent methyltransferase [Clostridia bacterium]
MSTDYNKLSEVYDELLYDVPGAEWAEYLIKLLPGPGPLSLLEYACGSGRLTQEFLRRGHTVIGVDRAEGMLAQAADKLRPLGRPYQLACCDMTEFRLVRPVDAAVCGLDAVNYLTTPEELKRFLDAAAANLRDGGVLLFDISTVYRLQHVLGNEFYYDDGENQTLFWQNHYDEQTALLEMTLTVFSREDGETYHRFDEVHLIRGWSEEEIRRALGTAGFTGVEAFAFGTEHPPQADCERIEFRAVKRS